MTGPTHHSHLIYAQILTGVYQAIWMFSPCNFRYLAISIARNSSLSLSTPTRTKWTLDYIIIVTNYLSG